MEIDVNAPNSGTPRAGAAAAGKAGSAATDVASAPRGDAEAPTEQRIFDAALEVFARKGRDGARMQEIADHAEINRALLHYYFRSKAQLYEAVFAHGFRQFIRSLRQSLTADLSFEDALTTFVSGYIDYIHEHQDMARLMLNECLCGGEVLLEYMGAALSEPDEFPGFLMQERIRVAQEAGEIRDQDPEHTMLTIVSACLFPFVALPTVRLFHPEVVEDFDRFVEARKRHVVQLLLGGLEPVPEGT
jgi:TetR/AcrR family transcriptional regulator